ncbi:hypothetical protein SAMN06265222_102289 [Neorhodopirellula lusitana]|uniref:Uncharacterized protein n=1 Tax=Neorhodopirellula lusitana TaxID=445327 RepID=A0ABY1PTY3_9BACT|nr:hypothetical protein [Neorhodopirellula lusitana]SMP47388.1 hypothetical protein SAMN06265222_102289 [Neorhodopirellula lusitana]
MTRRPAAVAKALVGDVDMLSVRTHCGIKDVIACMGTTDQVSRARSGARRHDVVWGSMWYVGGYQHFSSSMSSGFFQEHVHE